MRCNKLLLVAGALALGACSARAGAGVGVKVDTGLVEVDKPTVEEPASNRVWVCHRGRWQSVGAPAADAHSRHGDRISHSAQRARAGC